jgi:hypothetical protein
MSEVFFDPAEPAILGPPDRCSFHPQGACIGSIRDGLCAGSVCDIGMGASLMRSLPRHLSCFAELEWGRCARLAGLADSRRRVL